MFRGRGQRVTGCGKGCNGSGSTRVISTIFFGFAAYLNGIRRPRNVRQQGRWKVDILSQ